MSGCILAALITACVPGQRAVESAPSDIPPEAEPAVVTRVVDGDTIWVRPQPGGEELHVRLLEIDAPETSRDHGGPECYGLQATAFAEEQLAVGSVVHLLADQQDTDQFGRALRYLWTDDGTFFNQEAVRQGYARAVLYEPNDRFIQLMRAAEVEARSARRGLWTC